MLSLLLASLTALAAPKSWQVDPYVLPRVGGFVFTDGNRTVSGASLGAEAGLRYNQLNRPLPRWRGVARVAGDYVLTTSDASGMEARVGNLLGPFWKHVGAQTGPDLFWNQYTLGSQTLDPTLGLAWPVIGRAWNKSLSAYGGVEPAWLSNADRRVDWSSEPVPGFGHEFTWLGGVGFTVGDLGLSVGYRYRITAAGGQHGLSAGVSI